MATVDTDLLDSGLVDSLALVELLYQIEQEFGIAIPLDETDIERFRSIRTLGDLIAEQPDRRPA